jgi:uncharacterized protein HemY
MKAEEYYKEALAVSRLLGESDPNLANSLRALGSLAVSRGDFLLAEGYFREALSVT